MNKSFKKLLSKWKEFELYHDADMLHHLMSSFNIRDTGLILTQPKECIVYTCSWLTICIINTTACAVNKIDNVKKCETNHFSNQLKWLNNLDNFQLKFRMVFIILFS